MTLVACRTPSNRFGSSAEPDSRRTSRPGQKTPGEQAREEAPNGGVDQFLNTERSLSAF